MKMNSFLKNNKMLLVVLAVTFIAACGMVFHCIVVYNDIQNIMKQIEDDDNSMQTINKRQDPNPVRESEKIILENTEQLHNKIRSLRRKLGSPYRDELLHFLSNLESSAAIRPAAPSASQKEETAADAGKTVDAAVQTAQIPAVAGADGTLATEENNAEKNVPANETEMVKLHFNEDEIRSIFAEVYNEYYQDRKNDDTAATQDNERLVEEHVELFGLLRTRLTQPPSDMEFKTDDEKSVFIAGAKRTFDKAFDLFCKEIAANTIETFEPPSDIISFKLIFLNSLGLSRTMSSFNCKIFVDNFSTKIRVGLNEGKTFIPGLDKLVNAKGEKSRDLEIATKIPAFTFNHKNMRPPPGNVPHILRHYRILEDLFRRMRDSQIQYLMGINSPFSEKPTGDLSGDVIRELGTDYRKFTYEVTVVSTLQEVRNFINQLHLAYQQNFVYDIQEISFFKTAQMDEVKSAYDKAQKVKNDSEVEDESAGTSVVAENKSQDLDDSEGPDPFRSSSSENTKKMRKILPEEACTAPEYGFVVAGQNELVTTVIRFDFVQYIGENLDKRKD